MSVQKYGKKRIYTSFFWNFEFFVVSLHPILVESEKVMNNNPFETFPGKAIRCFGMVVMVLLGTTILMAQQSDPLVSVATIAGETETVLSPQDSTKTDSAAVAAKPIPLWKQKLYYGYNFDLYYHHDTRNNYKSNGWSIALEPEIGWKLKERIYLGLRVGGSYADTWDTYTSIDETTGKTVQEDLRVRQGSWNVTPYVRYRLKSMFNDKLGIWLEAHLYTGMEFPSVATGNPDGTDYDGLKHTIIYGAQISPVITYKFNRKSTFQIFFSILSLGYSGTTFAYIDPDTGNHYNEYTNDVIIFSGKLKNLIANQFTPGLYGLKFGVQKSF